MTCKINQEICWSISAVQLFPIGFQGAPTFRRYEWITKTPKLHMLSIFILGHLGQVSESQERDFPSRKRSRLAANCGITLSGKTRNVTHFPERTATHTW